jgi:hypothetical protein
MLELFQKKDKKRREPNSDKNIIPLAERIRYCPFQSVIFIAINITQFTLLDSGL